MESRESLHIHTGAGLYFLLAFALLLLPLQWICAVVFAALWHELCHYAAIRFCGVKPQSWRIGSRGMEMAIPIMPQWQELVCALAGPLGGLATLGILRIFPRFALCCVAHSLYNLLPVYPLDGGRVVRCTASLLFGEKGRTFAEILSFICVVAVVILGCYATFVWKLGWVALLPGTLLGVKSGIIKIPCKAVRKGVQ